MRWRDLRGEGGDPFEVPNVYNLRHSLELCAQELVPFQHGFDKLSSCDKLKTNLPFQEESNAQKNLHR